MPSHAAIRGDEVFPIPVAVMQPGTLAPVNLYIRIQGSAKFALYKKASSRLQEDTRQGLMSHRVDALYLRKTDEGAFHEYVENNIGAVIRDEFLSPPPRRPARSFMRPRPTSRRRYSMTRAPAGTCSAPRPWSRRPCSPSWNGPTRSGR